MLSGELPFNAPSTPALLVKQISERPTPVDVHRPDAPPDLARAVMMLLEKDPANRFPTADALVTALDTGDVPELPPSSFTHEPNRLAGIPTQSRDSWSRSAETGHRFGHGRRSDALARREGRRVPKEAGAVLRRERGHHRARDLRRPQPDGRRRNLERVPRVSVREALDGRIRLARRVQAAEGSAVLRCRGGIDRRFPRAVRQEEAHGGARARPRASAHVEPTPVRRHLGATTGDVRDSRGEPRSRVADVRREGSRRSAASRRHSSADRDAPEARARAGRGGAGDRRCALPSHRVARRRSDGARSRVRSR